MYVRTPIYAINNSRDADCACAICSREILHHRRCIRLRRGYFFFNHFKCNKCNDWHFHRIDARDDVQ